MCSITTVIYKAFYFKKIDNFIYMVQQMCNYYTWWFYAEAYCIWFKIFGSSQIKRCG